jgi:hypothetical protein
MNKLTMEDEKVFVECEVVETKEKYLGEIIFVGTNDYTLDIANFTFEYVNEGRTNNIGVTEEVSSKLAAKANHLFTNVNNNFELIEFVNKDESLEIMTMYNKKIVLVCTVKMKNTFFVFDLFLDMEHESYRYNLLFENNHFNKNPLMFRETTDRIVINLDENYFARVYLITGEKQELYNSGYHIDFGEGRVDLMSLL